MPFTALDQATQNAYADLHSACLTPAFDGKGISFTSKNIRGNKYLYISAKIDQVPIQRYLGPDNPETRQLIEKEKALWHARETARPNRARLVNMTLSGGMAGPTPQEGRILRLLERAGVFLSGGVLIGTPAFRTIGSMIGVSWEGQFATRDVDIAADYRTPIAVHSKAIDLESILMESGMGFIGVPALNPKHPFTTYKMKGGEYSVELLTPELGKPTERPIKIPYLNASAAPLRYLDYLIEETQPAVILFGIGILVNIPDPARFAVHKLVVSQRRPSAFTAKSAKDIDQARQVLEALFETRPGSVIAAVEAAEQAGTKFMRQFRLGAKLLPKKLQESLSEWCEV